MAQIPIDGIGLHNHCMAGGGLKPLLRNKQGIVGEGIPFMGAKWGEGLVVWPFQLLTILPDVKTAHNIGP